MKNIKIYIARHGQNLDNEAGILNGHRDEPLTQLGLMQAIELAEHLKRSEITFDKVYTSPLLRAKVTANTITSKLGIKSPKVLNSLIERDFGCMTGKKIDDIETLCTPDIVKAEKIVYFLSPLGAETFPQLVKRGNDVLEYIDEHNDEGTSVLLVCHGDIGKMIYTAYYNLLWEEVLTDFHFGNSELLLLSEETTPDNAHVFKQKQHNH